MSNKRLGNKFLLLFIISCFMFQSFGCSISMGSPQKKPETTRDDIKKMVEKEIQSPDTQKKIEDAVATKELKELLKTPEADKVVQQELVDSFAAPKVSKELQKSMKDTLGTPEVQKLIQEHIKKALSTPEMQSTLEDMIKQSLVKVLQGGQGGQGGQAGQGGQGGQGGGSSMGG